MQEVRTTEYTEHTEGERDDTVLAAGSGEVEQKAEAGKWCRCRGRGNLRISARDEPDVEREGI